MTFSYDRESDVLYLTFEKRAPDTYGYVENESGDILKLDKEDHRVVGCTIPGFMRRSRDSKIVVPEVGGLKFNEAAEIENQQLTHSRS